MATITPSLAIVRPRATARNEDGPRPLDEIIAEIADELSTGIVWVVGGPGSGKSTALAHLEAVFAEDDRLAFLDEPLLEDLGDKSEIRLVVAASCSSPKRKGIFLRLHHWGLDELVEYVLQVKRTDCNSVMARLGKHAAGP